MEARLTVIALLTVLVACGDDGRPTDTGTPSDAAMDATGDSSPADAADGGDVLFACTMGDLVKGDQCGCLAEAVCVQIYRCLDSADIAGRDPAWSPIATCMESVDSDCQEDIGDISIFPSNIVQCIADIQMASCADFGTFMSIAGDFPPTCANLRTVESALGIGP